MHSSTIMLAVNILRADMQKDKARLPAHAQHPARAISPRRKFCYDRRMFRFALCLIAVLTVQPLVARAQSCALSFQITLTNGIAPLPMGATVTGSAEFRLTGDRVAQEGGATTHLTQGKMSLGPDITGDLWALGTTSNGALADMIAIFARDVAGLADDGLRYGGPMMITLYGPPGSRADSTPPTQQRDWDAMTGPRRFALHAYGHGRVAGDVTELTLTCGDSPGD